MEGEPLNYGTDAQQHLGANALRMGVVISLTPSHLFTDSWHPAGAGLVWVLPQLERSASSKPSPYFQMGSSSRLLSLPSSLCRPIRTRHAPHRASVPADNFNCFATTGSVKWAQTFRQMGGGGFQASFGSPAHFPSSLTCPPMAGAQGTQQAHWQTVPLQAVFKALL